MVLNDKAISKLATEKDMIVPFISSSVNRVNGEDGYKVLSFGTSSYGYDVRLSREIKIFTNINGCVVDPKCLDHKTLIDAEATESSTGVYTVLPPNSYLLGRTMEYFKIPRDVLVIAVGKSTLARAGVLINVTPIEPGFEGKLTLQITNLTNKHLRVYLDEGVAKLVFSTTDL